MNRRNELRRYEEILSHAKRFLAGELGVIATARALAPFRHDVPELSDVLLVFAGIDSETDSLPIGDVRQHWNTEALERKDREIKTAEELYRPAAVDAATRLILLLEARQ